MPNMELETRHLTTDDVEQYNALLRYAFQITEHELSLCGWRDDEIKQSKFPILERADVLGCFDREKLVSQVAVYPLKMNVYHAVYEVGFVTSVCTYPEYTGNGIMKRLILQSLEHMRHRKQSLALLFPYSIPLYRKMGWEIISNKITYVVKDRQIPAQASAQGYVRRVEWENEDFRHLHAQFASTTHGCLFRNTLAWEEYWRWDEDDTVVAIYYDVNGKPCGYMVYLIKDDIMHIKEMIYLTHEAQEGLWAYIRAHDSMIDEVRGSSYTSEPIAFELEDGDIRETIRPYIMGRIVDVERFFQKYHCDLAANNVVITFDLEDSFLPWNNGRFTIRFHQGECSLTQASAQTSVKLSVATLTTLLLGYKTASQLQYMGKITAGKEAVCMLDDALLHEMPYISDYI
ncbi:GNAT family N-acetyltransferase [Oscillospiraceae bacterium 21-37]